ncbi:MAG: orotidine-5'-phosphate decarboxylase, partial [Deltaproteobacteria bacterium]|nr:orotidine-5'-phosphate decarboxylase [Deltaproteobacteria bacterium]
MKTSFPKLIVALDMEGQAPAKALVKRLGKTVSCYKVGMKLFTRYGPDLIKWLHGQKKQTFLDLKFHDIPNTVAEACREACRLKVTMLTLHTSGGSEMMQAAAKAIKEEASLKKIKAPKLLGVTVLTSLRDLSEVGVRRSIKNQVNSLAALAYQAGLDGVVCSPLEIKAIRQSLGKKALIVTPGV